MIAPRRLVHLPAVARPTSPTRRKPARRAALAASLVFHVVLLAVLGWRAAPQLTPAEADREPPAVALTLVRPTPSTATSRPAASRAPDTPPPLTALPRPATALPLPVPTPRPAPFPAPAPAASAAPVAGTGTGVHPGPLPGAEAGGDFRGFLRAGVGCAHRDGVGLTRAERDLCDQKAGEVAKAAPTMDKIAPEKRAYYDAVAAAQEAMRYATPVVRTPVLGGNMYTDPPTAMPGRAISLTCSPLLLLKGAKKALPRHSLVAGPCAIIPPVGPLNPDNDVRPPDTLKEREAEARKLKALDPPKASDAPLTPPGT